MQKCASVALKSVWKYQQNLYHVFIDFQKAFDRVWHAALWAIMRKYNINANLVRAIKHLYDKALSAIQLNGNTGEWFRTTAGVRQGCLLSPTLQHFSRMDYV
ncbi:MAG: reverse transcriptase domain-containing protein [Candidatus Thiodiazotropha sp.]